MNLIIKMTMVDDPIAHCTEDKIQPIAYYS